MTLYLFTSNKKNKSATTHLKSQQEETHLFPYTNKDEHDHIPYPSLFRILISSFNSSLNKIFGSHNSTPFPCNRHSL